MNANEWQHLEATYPIGSLWTRQGPGSRGAGKVKVTGYRRRFQDGAPMVAWREIGKSPKTGVSRPHRLAPAEEEA